MTNQKDTFIRVRQDTEADAQAVKDLLKQIEEHKEKIASINTTISFLCKRIEKNNDYLKEHFKEHKLEPVEFVPPVKRGRRIATTPSNTE